jgi:hypothetical protein
MLQIITGELSELDLDRYTGHVWVKGKDSRTEVVFRRAKTKNMKRVFGVPAQFEGKFVSRLLFDVHDVMGIPND